MDYKFWMRGMPEGPEPTPEELKAMMRNFKLTLLTLGVGGFLLVGGLGWLIWRVI